MEGLSDGLNVLTIAEFQVMRMQPALERALGRRGLLKAQASLSLTADNFPHFGRLLGMEARR